MNSHPSPGSLPRTWIQFCGRTVHLRSKRGLLPENENEPGSVYAQLARGKPLCTGLGHQKAPVRSMGTEGQGERWEEKTGFGGRQAGSESQAQPETMENALPRLILTLLPCKMAVLSCFEMCFTWMKSQQVPSRPPSLV